MPLFDRVVVVGTSGSGKTTLAAAIASRTGAPNVELDALHWQPGWTPAPREELRATIDAFTSRPRWVVDGNYDSLRDIVWPRATLIVWLDYPFPIVFARVVRRTVSRIVTRQELFSGNRESFRQSFLSRHSVILWMLTTFRRRRRTYAARMRASAERAGSDAGATTATATPVGPEWRRCGHPSDADRLLESIPVSIEAVPPRPLAATDHRDVRTGV